MRGGSKLTVRPLIEAAVIAAGAAGISAEAILEQIPQSTILTVTSLLSRMVTGGTFFAAGHYSRRHYFACQADAVVYATAYKAKQKAHRRAQDRIRDRASYRASRSQKPRVPRKGAWSPEQLERLRTEYPVTDDPKALAASLGRTHHGLMMKASELGITRPRRQAAHKPQAAKPVKSVKVAKAIKSAPKIAHPRGPAYLPGDVDTLPRSPGFRHIVYPSKPAPLRTNTFSQFG